MKKTIRIILIVVCLATMAFAGWKIFESRNAQNNSDLVELNMPNTSYVQIEDDKLYQYFEENLPEIMDAVNKLNPTVPGTDNNISSDVTDNQEDNVVENGSNDIFNDEVIDDNFEETKEPELPVVVAPIVVDKWTYTDAWKEKNSDVSGTISINVLENEPIVTTPNNQNEYLRKNIFGKYSVAGTLFTAYDSVLGETNVTTIFGHSMKNGSMFGTLKKFKTLDYLKQNPTFTMTSATKEYTLKIVGVADVSSNYKDMGWYYAQSKLSEKEFAKFEKEVRTRSFFVIPDEFDYESKYVILSCCDYTFEGERLIIVARIMEDGETVDTSAYAKNPVVLRANEYYKAYNKTKPSKEKIEENYNKNY